MQRPVVKVQAVRRIVLAQRNPPHERQMADCFANPPYGPALPLSTDSVRAPRHVRKVQIGDMLAKARIRANAQWSFVYVRKRPSAVNLSGAARNKQAAIVAQSILDQALRSETRPTQPLPPTRRVPMAAGDDTAISALLR